jgi:hypothetical protein
VKERKDNRSICQLRKYKKSIRRKTSEISKQEEKERKASQFAGRIGMAPRSNSSENDAKPIENVESEVLMELREFY